MMRDAVFLDRDGVIIEDRADFVKCWDEVAFVPSAFDAIAKLTDAGLPIVIVTNQSAIGRGIITQSFLMDLHAQMLAEIESHGGRIAGVYFCPHHPNDGCSCRKPLPGMIFRAAADLDINLGKSYLVGDSATDIQAANAAGVNPVLVLTGKGEKHRSLVAASSSGQTPAIAANLGEAADLILTRRSMR